MSKRDATYRDVLRLNRQKQIGAWLSANCAKPANSVNGVTYSELMNQLRGEE